MFASVFLFSVSIAGRESVSFLKSVQLTRKHSSFGSYESKIFHACAVTNIHAPKPPNKPRALA